MTVLLSCGLAGLPAAAADVLFLSVEGVMGDSTDREHPGWIDALALAHDLEISCMVPGGSGSGCDAPSFGAVSVLKQTDQATPALFDLVSAGTTGLKVIVEACRQTAIAPECYYRVTLNGASLESLRLSADTCADPLVCGGTQNESLDVRFTRITWRFVPYANGNAGPAVERCWNVELNVEC